LVQQNPWKEIGCDEDYKNVDVSIWMLNKDVDEWGIELKLETPQIEWCFQFKKWKDLDNMKYVHVVNLKNYKDDSYQVVVFLLVPFSTLKVKIMCIISKMSTTYT